MSLPRQGPLMMAEYRVVRWSKQHGNNLLLLLPSWAARPLLLCSMLLLGHHLFFAPVVVDTDTADRVLHAILAIYRQLGMMPAAAS